MQWFRPEWLWRAWRVNHNSVFSLVSLSVNPPEKVSALLYFGWAFLLLPLTAEELQQFNLTGWKNLLFAFSNISSALWYYHNNEKGLKGWERFVRFRKVSGLETKFTSSKEVTELLPELCLGSSPPWTALVIIPGDAAEWPPRTDTSSP